MLEKADRTSFLGRETKQRTMRFPHQNFRVAGREKIRQFTGPFVTQPRVKLLRATVEFRNAEKHIRALAQNPFLGKPHDFRADAFAVPAGTHREELNVAVERTVQMQQQHPDDLRLEFGDMGFAGGVGEPLKQLFRSESQREPGFGSGQETGAKARFGHAAQGPDDEIVHQAENAGNGGWKQL